MENPAPGLITHAKTPWTDPKLIIFGTAGSLTLARNKNYGTGDAFTFVSREDEPLVRSIERVLGEKIERRTMKGFDYTKAAPARDAEFARPPREPQHRRPKPKPAQGGPHGQAGGRPRTHQAQHQRSDVPRSSSSSAPAPHAAGTRTFKPRTRRYGPGR